MVSFLWRLRKTIKQCGGIIDREEASVILGMGGFTSFLRSRWAQKKDFEPMCMTPMLFLGVLIV
jgi:UDP-N-acetylglucosamine:LPS N-acetylglucosamine transferase